MTDYTAEVEARLHAQGYECHCTSPDDCCQDCADIRAALGEIERLQGRVAGEHFESVAWQNRAECLAAIGQARTQDEDTPEEIAEERITSLVAENDQLKAKLAEAQGTLATESAERIRCRDEWAKSEAEVERLTTTVAHLSKRASEYEADRDRNAALCMDAVADANRLRDLILWCESDDSEEGHAWDALMDEARKIRAALRGGGE